MNLYEGKKKVEWNSDTLSYAGNFWQYKYSLNWENNGLEEDRSHCEDTTSHNTASS